MAITALIPRREKCKSYQTAKSMVEKKKKSVNTIIMN